MLKSLQVKDYALIEEVNVSFDKGLNIITGETGAGKSILVDALGLLLGERASTEVVRKGTVKSIVEGIFEVGENKKVKNIIENNEIDFSPELILRREISLKGSNRCFINDTPVSLNLVKEIGDLLIDLHGQHEHQSLLRSQTHIDFVDEYGNLEEEINQYKSYLKIFNSLSAELKSLREKENILNEKKDLYLFQIKEIDAVSPEEGEDEKITENLKVLENSERLLQLSESVYQKLYESENSVYDSLGTIRNELNELFKFDKSFTETLNEFENALTLINDMSEFTRNYKTKIDIEPEHLEKLRERLASLNHLKKKHGGSLALVIAHRKEIGEEYNLIENYSENISRLEKQIDEERRNCGNSAEKISKKRKEISKKIERDVVDVLSSLGIADSKFQIKITDFSAPTGEDFILVKNKPAKFNSKGIDEVEFFLSTNKGEDTKPLVKVASGGEVSRIMLALKTILAKSDKLPLLIFDEIDTGVSGKIAQKVGNSLKSLASFHQLIVITHLPQIAGLADHHFLVEKSFSDGRVITSVKQLNEKERIKEVAKLMSGENITEANIKGAKELMGLLNN